MIKKKIIIISHVIYPAQNPRAHRATELAIELAKQGHDITLYAVLGNYNYSDFKVEHNLKIRNISKMIFVKLNSDGLKLNSFFDKFLNKLLHRLVEFPDIEFMFRIPHIIKREKNVDLLISVAKPFPIHWGCALSKKIFKKSFPAIWAADCGDPYMGNNKDQEHKKYFYFKYIEKWYCRLAEYIVVPHQGAIEGYYPEFSQKIRVIPQGFRFDSIKLCLNRGKNEVPTFAYSGVFYQKIRNPVHFLDFLSSLNQDFKFIVYTNDRDIINPYCKILGSKIEIRDYIPREQLLYELSKMDFVINFENSTNMHLPSKLIDYALIKRPILSIPNQSLPIKTFNEFLEGNYQNQFIMNNIEHYNISNVALQFISLLSQKSLNGLLNSTI
jgi:hypothetical protein